MATTAVQRIDTRLPAPLTQELRAIMSNLPALLPPDIPFEQFRAGLWLELQQQSGIEDCNPASIVACVVKAANAGLLPGRDCHLIAFRNQGKREATLVPNYQGIILALERSGKVKKAFAHAVYAKDHFEVDYLEDRFSHKPCLTSQRGSVVCFYGCVVLKDGTKHFEVMTLEQIDAIRRKAPRHDSGPWATHFDEMARKTALKRVAKYVRLAPQQQQLLEEDDARERTDPAPERFRENVSDLYGDPRDVPNFGQQPSKEAENLLSLTDETHQEEKQPTGDPEAVRLIEQIGDAWRAFGLTGTQLDSYWNKAEEQEGLRLRLMTPAHLRHRLEEVQRWIAKQPKRTPEPEPKNAPPAWRAELTALLATFRGDDALLKEMFDAVDHQDTPDAEGAAVLARAQEAIAAREIVEF